ncbi:MAG: ABC transporter ATP-binding protein [Acidimicrobiia bacterium]|nr:ABC transporter ATP-binding protein [Acidimicrobiia bacterium]
MAPRDKPSGGQAVELRGITKRFPGVVANHDVNLSVARGEIHAIVGENGAGKSTLMKTLYGMHQPDEGAIIIEGETCQLRSPNDAIALGIGMVHQHFMLADNFTVLENIILGGEPTHGPVLDRAGAQKRIVELAQRYGFPVDPDALVEDLGVGDRQRVEILKVLYRGARTLILDEPTAVLVPHEVDELFRNLRDLVDEGVTVIFISHKLDEVLSIADSITVIRAGTTVTTVDPGSVTAHELAELMVGSELPTPETRESTVTTIEQLRLSGVTIRTPEGRPLIEDISFAVHRGEVVGIAGVEGNGQHELISAILGTHGLDHGTVTFAGDDITRLSTRRRRELGLGYIPQDRHREGLLLDAPLWENAMLGHQARAPFSRGPWLDRAGAKRRTAEIVADFDVRTPGVDVPAFALSGGNQQKLIVGREMSADPSLLVAAHPTRGIDVGAQAAVWEQLREARSAGLAVLLISADLEELIGLSDRLLVIYGGRLVAELDPAQVTAQELGSHMTGAGHRGTTA